MTELLIKRLLEESFRGVEIAIDDTYSDDYRLGYLTNLIECIYHDVKELEKRVD